MSAENKIEIPSIHQRIDALYELFEKNKFGIDFGIACHIPDISTYEDEILLKILQNIFKEYVCTFTKSMNVHDGKYFELKMTEEKKKIVQLQNDIANRIKYLTDLSAIENKVRNEIKDLKKILSELTGVNDNADK